MTREELFQRPVAELVELILQQQVIIAQLEAKVVELEARLARPRKTPTNSSVPPAKGYKANRKPSADKPRKRGPREGHPGTTRPPAEPHVRIEAKVEQCDRCGYDLCAAEHHPVERRQVVEIPPMRPL